MPIQNKHESLNLYSLHNDFDFSDDIIIIDTGAQLSIIKEGALCQNITICISEKRPVRGIGQLTSTTTIGSVKGNLTFNGIPFLHSFQIMSNVNLRIPADGLLGNDFLSSYGAVLRLSQETMELRFPKYYMKENTRQICKFNEEDISPKLAVTQKEKNERKIDRNNFIQTGILNYDSESKTYQNDLNYDAIEFINSEELNKEYFMQQSTERSCAPDMKKKCSRKIKKDKNKDFYKNLNSIDYVETINLTSIDIEMKHGTCMFSNTEETIFDAITTMNENTEIIDPNERTNYLMQKLKLDHCDLSSKNAMKKLCRKFSKVFFIEGDRFEHTDVIHHRIPLKPGTNPIFTRQYRIPENQKEEVQRQIDEMEGKGIIEKSNSPWNSPLLLVPKKSDETGEKKFRLVIDYRKLNSVTMPQTYPTPLIDEIIDQMNNAKLFTTLDLQGAFHQIPMDPASKEYTAFSTSIAKYQFRSSPFGLLGSPYSWLRCIHTVLTGLIGYGCFVYMDDIIIYSNDLDGQVKILENVFQRLLDHKLVSQHFWQHKFHIWDTSFQQTVSKPILKKLNV